MKNLLILLFICITAISCDNHDDDLDINGTYIRIENNSNFTFEEVVVNTSGGENNFGKILPGTSSEYLQFTFAYKYAFIKLNIEGVEYKIQPYDYFGENKVELGKHTYILQFNNQNKKLEITYKQDRL